MTTTESQITSGKAESTIDTLEFDQLLEQYFEADHSNHDRYHAALIAHIEAWGEKIRDTAARDKTDYANQCIEDTRRMRERAEKAEADRDHFKAIAERQAADLSLVTPEMIEAASCAAVPDKDGGFYYPFNADEIEHAIKAAVAVAPRLSPAQQEPAAVLPNGATVTDVYEAYIAGLEQVGKDKESK